MFPLMVQHMIPRIGFGWTMRTCAFLVLGLLIFANLAIRSNLEHHPRRFDILDYFRPLREPSFAILSVASFFMYCRSSPCARDSRDSREETSATQRSC